MVVVLSSGCAMVEDFDQYSSRYGEGADSGDDAGAVIDSASVDDVSDDTGTSAPMDTGTAPTPDAGCGAGKLHCDGGCVDILGDRDHCGGCSSCEEQGLLGATSCSAGKCGCRSGAIQCGNTCTYTDNDPLHCKGCNRPVEDATVVCGGTCSPPLRTCISWGYGTTCPVECVDTASEGNHCYEYSTTGTKYVRCWGSNAGACVGGMCKGVCSGTGRKECVAGFNSTTDSNVRTCADTLHDPNHCGDCGKRCAAGQLCAEGVCKRYRPARSALDCTKSEAMYTPPSWTKSVCVPL